MAAKLGRPAPGTRRLLTTNEGDAICVGHCKSFEVECLADGSVVVWKMSLRRGAIALMPSTSVEVKSLEDFWTQNGPQPIHRHSGVRPPTTVPSGHPRRRIVSSKPSRYAPNRMTDVLACGHEMARKQNATRPQKNRVCTHCPKEGA